MRKGHFWLSQGPEGCSGYVVGGRPEIGTIQRSIAPQTPTAPTEHGSGAPGHHGPLFLPLRAPLLGAKQARGTSGTPSHCDLQRGAGGPAGGREKRRRVPAEAQSQLHKGPL